MPPFFWLALAQCFANYTTLSCKIKVHMPKWVESHQPLRRNRQRATALFFLYFLAVFGGFLSILIPFLTSCDPHPPCVPHLSVAFYVVKGKASPEQFQRGFAVFSASSFSTRWTTRKPHRGHPMRWDAIIKENRQHGVRSSGKSEAGEKTGVACKERLHTIQ